MKKIYRQIYRVECNRGSKYFSSLTKANRHFDTMVARGYDTELWESTIRVTVPSGFPVSAKQVLLKCSFDTIERYV